MSSLIPIQFTMAQADMTGRFVQSASVVGSPATNAETIIASVAIPTGIQILSGVELFGWCSFTGGTSGVSATMKIRQTNTSGATVATSGATTIAATNLYQPSIMGFDAAPVAGQIYKLTLTIGSGAGTSTVGNVYLRAMVM